MDDYLPGELAQLKNSILTRKILAFFKFEIYATKSGRNTPMLEIKFSIGPIKLQTIFRTWEINYGS